MKYLLAIALTCLLGNMELEKRQLLDNRLEMKVPKHFRWMTTKELTVKYGTAANAPKLVLSNEELNVNLAFNHTAASVTDATLPEMRDFMKKQLETAYPSVQWKGEEIKVINGTKSVCLKLVAERGDKTYNYMLLTQMDKRLLIISFNCAHRLMQQWEQTAEEIMNSVVIQ